jgi:exosome complex protein LRP1
MIEREQYEREMKDLGSEEEDTLEVFDDIPGEQQEDELVTEKVIAKGKQKAGSSDVIMKDDSPLGTKRRRPAMDPFGGEFGIHLLSKVSVESTYRQGTEMIPLKEEPKSLR